MIDHTATVLALRAHLRDLVVCQASTALIGASGSAYTRNTVAYTNLVTTDDLTAWDVQQGAPDVTAGISDPYGGTDAYRVTDDVSQREIIHTLVSLTVDGCVTAVVREATMPASGTQRIAVVDETAAANRLECDITSWVGGVPQVTVSLGTLLAAVTAVGNGYYMIRCQCSGVVSGNTHRVRVIAANTTGATGAIDVYRVNAFNATTSPVADILDASEAIAAGSWITDGFRAGMELTADDFDTTSNEGTAIIQSVTAATLTIDRALTSEDQKLGRTVAVYLPSGQSWENVHYRPTAGRPWVEEQYLPGGGPRKITLGPLGELELLPIYSPRVYCPPNTGREAASAYADAIIEHFAPETSITIASGSLRVRGDTGPFPGQLFISETGQAVVPVSIPLRYRTPNSI